MQCQWLTGDYGYYGAGCAAGTEPINVGYTGAAWATYAGNLGAGQNFGGGVCVVGTCGLEFSYTDSGHLDSEACVEADPANIPLYGNCVYSRVP